MNYPMSYSFCIFLIIMRNTILICLLLVTTHCMAQGIIPYHPSESANDNVSTGPSVTVFHGVPFPHEKYTRIAEGTPFFSERWMQGKVLLENGAISALLSLRLNLVENAVHYMDKDGAEMVISAPLRYLVMTDPEGRQYNFLHGDQLTDDKELKDAWFQVLVNADISLCRLTRKAIRQSGSYGTTITEQTIQTTETYFVKRKNDFIRIRKWDDLLAVMDDKKDLVRSYSREHHLNGRNEKEYIEILDYYNHSL